VSKEQEKESKEKINPWIDPGTIHGLMAFILTEGKKIQTLAIRRNSPKEVRKTHELKLQKIFLSDHRNH